MIKKKIIIIGAGPMGLSVAWRLKKQNFNDFLILEKNSYIGGLSASFQDDKGFFWDIGGHVIHDKQQDFVKFCQKILKKNVARQKRKAYIYFKNYFIPYPFQNNISFLPKAYRDKCLKDLENLRKTKSHPKNFYQWILSNFGEGIAKFFMVPQNEKSWTYPLEQLNTNWLSKKISLPPLSLIRKEFKRKNKKILDWGPHQYFFYPKKGGIGFLWRKMASLFKNSILFETKAKQIDIVKKTIIIQKGKVIKFDILISTIPINELINISNSPRKTKILSSKLKYNSGIVIGLGFSQQPKFKDWHWIYFPNKKYPFFRLCLLSKIGEKTVPNKKYSSFLVEISTRKKQNKRYDELINKISKQIGKIFFDNENIKPITTFSFFPKYYYPIPTLDRDKTLKTINQYLNLNQIYSIGRFGSWKYELGNMDNCFMEAKNFMKTFNLK